MKNNCKKIVFTVLLSALLLSCSCALVQAKTVTTKVTGEINYTESFRFLKKLNTLRKSKGLKPVKMDKKLLKAAELRAAEIGVLYSHTRPNAKKCTSASPLIKGENIAVYDNADTVFVGWKNSPGHYKNMTTAKYTSVGICCMDVGNKICWVNLFGTKPAKTVKKSGRAKKTFSVAIDSRYLTASSISYEGPYTMQTEESKQIKMSLNVKISEFSGYLPADLFRFTSSNPAVCKVSAAGMLTSCSEGTTVITIALKSDPSIKKQMKLTIDDGFWSYGDDEFDD